MSDERKELYKYHTELPWAIPAANVFRVVALGEDGEAERCIVEDTAPEDVFFGDKQIGWGEFYDNESDQEYYGREAAANARYIVKACNEYPVLATRIAELEGLLATASVPCEACGIWESRADELLVHARNADVILQYLRELDECPWCNAPKYLHDHDCTLTDVSDKLTAALTPEEPK